MSLPIEAVLPELLAALSKSGVAVLQAPPGAGKTTRVPLALLPVVEGRIVMLEPRRLATRAAAMRMAETRGEPVGRTVGFSDARRVGGVGSDADRGGDRGHPDADAPIGPGSAGHRRGDLRRVPRALAQRRSGPRADLGGAAGAAARPVRADHVGNAGRGARGGDVARAGGHVGGPRLRGRAALARPAAAFGTALRGAGGGAGGGGDERRGGRRAGLPAGRGRDPTLRRTPGWCGGRHPPALRRLALRGAEGRHRARIQAQGRTRHVHRGDLADDRGSARGGRWWAGAARAVRPRIGHVALGDGAGDARRSHAAGRARGTGRRRARLRKLDARRRGRNARLPGPRDRERGPFLPGSGAGRLGL